MKTLKEHTILYDAECPMCNLYTKAFVKTGMLDRDGREPYQAIPAELCSAIDQKRAVDEIALVHKSTGKVYYGVDSLFLILGNALPVFKPVFRLKPFRWLIKKLYRFISFNRRVIIPAAHGQAALMDQPSFNRRYRIAYLIFTWLTTAFVLYNYSKLFDRLIPPSNFYREFLICGGQIFWQWTIISRTNKNKTWAYLGNLMTISFAGALMLSIGLLVAGVASLSPIVFGMYFMFVAGLMLLEHIRRTKILAINWMLSLTWVLYRIILLILILY